jgi:hypothetical protein
MKYFLFLALVVTGGFAQSHTNPVPDGEIRGSVTDQDGKPVSGAMVFALPQDLTFDGIAPRSAKTDKDGKFVFRGRFRPGTYMLYSRKEEAGYPDPSDSFYANAKEKTEIHLTADHPSATIKVPLGERAGVLEGRIIDVNTGAAIKAQLVFYDQNGNKHFLTVNGSYRALLPPGKDVSLMVMSPTYRSRVAVARLQVEPGQLVHMDIPLAKD